MGLGKILTSRVVAGFLALSAVVPQAHSETRINPSVQYHHNIEWPGGTVEDYNPKVFRLGFEFDNDFIGFNKITVAPFLSYAGKEEYERGIEVDLKKIFSQYGRLSPYIFVGTGLVYASTNFKRHKTHLNYLLSFGGGAEVELNDSWSLTGSAGYRHMSNGKKFGNNLKNGSFDGNNEGNPGVNGITGSVGMIHRFEGL